MRKFLYLLILLLTALTQIAWAPFLMIRGFSLPLVLLVLFLSTYFYQVMTVFIFAFGIGIFINLLAGGIVGSQSLALISALGSAYIMRNLFLGRKWLGFLLASVTAVIINYAIWFFLF
ncbi:MAG: hypothetical protein FJ044_05875 [Candidatus Cloacimonetes bacterium]|nr:hypothetical protein [Candidatus Cloacimonadota bacterium]